MEDLSAQFETMSKQLAGFQSMMKDTLDTLNTMSTRQAAADEMLRDLRSRTDAAASNIAAAFSRVDSMAARMQSLEQWPSPVQDPGPPPIRVVTPAQPPSPPRPPPHWLDLNLAPASTSRPPVMDGERPKGHDALCGGILGPRP